MTPVIEAIPRDARVINTRSDEGIAGLRRCLFTPCHNSVAKNVTK